MENRIIYKPLTATPFKCNSAYNEIEPCWMLKPYIRCFWGGVRSCSDIEADIASEIVIPDTCVDIIYRIDDTGKIINSDFIGINDRSFFSQSNKKSEQKIFVFAIRFYAWTAYIFSEDSFAETVNGRYDVRERFSWLDRKLRVLLPESYSLIDLIRFTEPLFLKKLETAKKNEMIDRVIYDILLHQGGKGIHQLSKENFISGRQMERLFHEYIGITPKKLSNLVRYQCLWRDIVSERRFDILDAVYKYGYTDVSHLMREFERYHSMNIRDALEMAIKNM